MVLLYRIMRCDGLDIKPARPPVPSTNLAVMAANAVLTGTTSPSPFLHFTKDVRVANKYRSRCGLNEQSVAIVKLDTDSLPCKDVVIDISSADNWRKIAGGMEQSEICSDFALVMRRSKADKEVLLQWRGCLNVDLLTVVEGPKELLRFNSQPVEPQPEPDVPQLINVLLKKYKDPVSRHDWIYVPSHDQSFWYGYSSNNWEHWHDGRGNLWACNEVDGVWGWLPK